jgi:cytochrome c-type biogenesis protein CcmH
MTLEFGLAAALLVLITMATILLPLLRRKDDGVEIERGASNLQLLREQLSEIDADLRSGVLSADQYENARVDLERRVLDESQQAIGPTSRAPIGRRWRTPVVVGLFVPVCAALLYVYLGSFDGLDVEAYMQKQAAAISPEQVVSMTRQLAQRLEKEPDDVEGWMMLGRSYMALQQYPDSARAWQRAATLAPDNASILTNYAEAIALASQGNFDGEAARLLARALDADPVHPKALALSGGAAFGRGEYRTAIDYWQRLLLLGGDDGELSAALMTGIAKAQERLNEGTEIAKASGSMRGVVSLSPQMSASAKSGDTVFIFVRAADGPRMPLAVARVTVDELPYDFHLDDSMAMVPDKKISDFQQLVVGARVSGTGTAGRTSGDLEGFSTQVGPVSSGIRVLIDRRVP